MVLLYDLILDSFQILYQALPLSFHLKNFKLPSISSVLVLGLGILLTQAPFSC